MAGPLRRGAVREKGKRSAGAVLPPAVAAGVLLYQRDQSARYPLDFIRDEMASASVSTYTETLALTGPEELDALYDALEHMRVAGETEENGTLYLGAQPYVLKIELKDGGGRTFFYKQRSGGSAAAGILSRSGHPDCQVRRLDLSQLWQSVTGEYPKHP